MKNLIITYKEDEQSKVLDLAHCLDKGTRKKFYVSNEDIKKHLENMDRSIYVSAAVMVSERKDKYDLVELVSYFMHENEKRRQAMISEVLS